MNNQARRRVQVTEDHYLYQSNQHLENNNHTAYDDVDHTYDANTSIATVRCFWQHIVSSTVGANLVKIRVIYNAENDNGESIFDENVMDHYRDGTPVTIGYLAGLGMNNVHNDPDFSLFLFFVYVMDNVVDEPHCICNL